MKELQWDVILFIWIFNLIFFVLQEVGKLLVYWAFEYYYSFKAPEQQAYSGQYLTDSFLHFTTGYGDKKTIITRRSMAAAQEPAMH